MKTICVLDGRIVMSQDGDSATAMENNAAQYTGASVEVIDDDVFAARMTAQMDWRTPLIAKFRDAREIVLNRLTGIAGRKERGNQSALAQECDTAAQGLLDLTSRPSVVGATTEVEFKIALVTEYSLIAAALSEDVKSAFRGFSL